MYPNKSHASPLIYLFPVFFKLPVLRICHYWAIQKKFLKISLFLFTYNIVKFRFNFHFLI